ncbi:glycosyl transferase family 90 [Halomonas sp. SSL-5]|uniref:glycosyl transferase family 90 n=1 Tax=Halomonas sp. SSL-5 TaxID=3065855 RepID=UPI00273A121F|nr:glycosyl transferase family 90 [Halomonas sp. SSL-5]MDY7116109.1 glycosyl transferase family 90 [Halomonas sp. SSL-5]
MKSGKNAYRAHKFMFYTTGLLGSLVPRIFFRHQLKPLLDEFDTLPSAEQEAIMERVEYYNKLDNSTELSSEAVRNDNFRIRAKKSTYHIDFYKVARYFPGSSAYHYRFGDKTFVPHEPTFVKSRPISENNQNSVLLKLDSVRHFYTVKDPYHYKNKKDTLVWRGAAHQPHRQHFLAQCHDMDLCDVGATDNKVETAAYRKPFMSIEQQFEHKFIFSIEGNDVATNLKWIMASNSLCFMKRPIYETWFMEGTLTPGHHYVEVSDDFSDLDEKIEYFLSHPKEAQDIIHNANRYIAKFYHPQRENLIALMVFVRYLSYTHQSF